MVSDAYVSYDIEDNDKDDKNAKECLGLDDFTFFNFMLLSIMHLIWSMTTKCHGIRMHNLHTNSLLWYETYWIYMWHAYTMSCLPFHVVIFSIYTIIIDFVMNYRPIDCSNYCHAPSNEHSTFVGEITF